MSALQVGDPVEMFGRVCPDIRVTSVVAGVAYTNVPGIAMAAEEWDDDGAQCTRCGRIVEPDDQGETFADTGLCSKCSDFNTGRVAP